jgi:uncharacterized membrane protein
MTKGRMEAFSDGVLAVAITLLVLDLHSSTEAGPLGRQLAQEWPSFVAYVVSFAVIGVIWVNHHALIALLARVDRKILFYNLFLLFWVTAIPFTTSTLAEFLRAGGWDSRVAVLLYGLTMEGMAVGFTAMLRHMINNHLTIVPVSPEEGRRALRRFGIGLFTYPLITAAGLLSPIAMLFLLAAQTAWYITEQTPILPAARDPEEP